MPRRDGRSRTTRYEKSEKKRYNHWDDVVEAPKPDPGPPPTAPRAPSLMTCPACGASAYVETKNDVGRVVGYCIRCAYERDEVVVDSKNDSSDVACAGGGAFPVGSF